MINIELTSDELNTLIHGLFVMEDQYWFRGHDQTGPLIKKLQVLQREHGDEEKEQPEPV